LYQTLEKNLRELLAYMTKTVVINPCKAMLLL